MLSKLPHGILTCYMRNAHINATRSLLRRYNSSVDKKRIRTNTLYFSGLGVLVIGLSYAAVPLYRIFCQSYSYGGTISAGHDAEKVEDMKPIKDRTIVIKFVSDVSVSMIWDFQPQQHSVKVVPGETALAFYTATNPTDKAICGISTYNVVPFEAGQYFNKIQCFCFEEQRLNPHEQVDLPVFFYIDPDFVKDPKMEHVDELTLSYTFFEAKDGINLPVPSYAQSHASVNKSVASN